MLTARGGARPQRGLLSGTPWGRHRVVGQRDQLVVLVFEIEQHRYGLDVRSVHEIVRAVQPTRLPEAPGVIAGVINVRGAVVPLLDLRLRFGLPARRLKPDEVFVLVTARGRPLALRADGARELLRVPADQLSESPRDAFAAGTAVLPDGLLVICDLDAFLDEAELMSLQRALVEVAS